VVHLALLLSCFGSSVSNGQALVVAVADANGVPDVTVRRVQRSTESALRQLTALSVREGPGLKRGAPKRCDDDCVQQLVRAQSAVGVVVLILRPLDAKGERVAVELQLWLEGTSLGARRGELSVEGFEPGARPLLEALLPGWARKGFGGVRVEAGRDVVVKVDGRLASARRGEVFAVPAGLHQIDLVFADGHAVLQRLEVVEGRRVRLEAADPAVFVAGSSAATGPGALRITSYGVWMVGAATVAGGLIAGALGKGTAAGLAPCEASTRDCATLDTVLERNRQAQAYASTGNVLLGVGTGLLAVGAGLFVIDVVAR
jgi:hypothetical protein